MRTHALALGILVSGWPVLATVAAPPLAAPAPKRHWAFRPLQPVAPPRVKDAAWARNPVDRFVLAKLEANGLHPSPPVDARQLIRRVYFDLTGLPPTPEEVEAFVKECAAEKSGGVGERANGRGKVSPTPPLSHSPTQNERGATLTAYERLVDRLLASPAYGERWGRHWLDVARYADSDGQESDADRPNAYHYRDFVIRALNEDQPFDTFVRWQLAGDEYEPDNPRAVAATGFITAGVHAVLNVPMEEEKIRARYDELDDQLTTTGAAFLGLTLGCARCHDHKYDPVPTRDYYRMLAAFNSGDRAEVPLLPRAVAAPRLQAEREWKGRRDAAKKELDGWVAAQKKPAAQYTTEERSRWEALKAALRAVEATRPEPVPTALAMADFGPQPRESWLLDRGDIYQKQERVELGFLTALTGARSPADYWAAAKGQGKRTDTTYQRRALAEWITDPQQGAGSLLARVAVNRLWQHHFGEGLVRTVNDFGTRGEAPSHPELLEWLASTFVEGNADLGKRVAFGAGNEETRKRGNAGDQKSVSSAKPWSLKAIHRLILLSSTYRQGAAGDPTRDPENHLLARRRPQRLEAEAFRDTMLAVSGTLNRQAYGPAFKPPIQPEAIQARNVKDPYPAKIQDAPENRRRTVYAFHKRVVQYPLLQAFDSPDAAASCGRRSTTTVAPQALAMLNEPFVRLRAGEFAARLRAEAGEDPAAQVDRAYRLALSRPPSPRELALALRFLEGQASRRAAREPGTDAKGLALTDFAQVLFGLNEFLYVD